MKIRSNTFINYLLSYIVTMIIPVCILGYILYSNYLGYFTETLLSNKFHSLTSIRSTIDMEISQLQTYAYRISNTQEFTSEYLNKRYAQFYDVFRNLSNIKYSDDFIQDILYVNEKLGYIYTPDTRFSFKGFETSRGSYDNYTVAQLPDYFTNLRESAWIPVQPIQRNSLQVLTYIIPIKSDKSGVYSFMAFQIDRSRFDLVAGATISEKNSGLLILDKHNDVLYTSNNISSPLPTDFIKAVEKGSEEKPAKIKLNDMDVLVYSFDSKAADIRYVSLIAYEEITKPLKTLKTTAIFALLLIVVLGSFAIYWSMKKNYKPLYALGQLAKSFLTSSNDGLNEIESTKQALANISRSNQEIRSKNYKFLKKDLLLKLFRNLYNDIQSFRTEAREIGVSLSGPYFCVSILKLTNVRNYKDNIYEKIVQLIEDTLASEIEVHTVEYSEDNSIILLLSGGSKNLKDIDNGLTKIQLRMKNELQLSCIIGMSNIYESLLKTSSYYLEARTAVKYQFMRGEDKVTSYQEISSASVLEYAYPSDEINALYNAILLGDSERIEFIIDMLIPSFHRVSGLFFAVCLGYDIVNTALRAMRVCNYSFTEFGKKYPDILMKTEFSSPDELINVVRKLSNEICEFINKIEKPGDIPAEETDDISAVISFIEQHYMEESFSTKVLADHFGKSISNFSHYFKKRTGQVVSEYINDLRFERAKELLRSTDMTIQEVASSSGYCHISTFMRQFKKMEGISPTAYRNMYRPIIRSTVQQ